MAKNYLARVFMALFLATMPGDNPVYADNVKHIKIGMSASLDPVRSEEFIWARGFTDVMKDGGFSTTYYPNGSFGGESIRVEASMLGLLELNFVGSEELKFYSAYVEASDLPFLFDSNRMFDRFLTQTDFLEKVNHTSVPHGIRLLDATLGGGMSGIFTARLPVNSLEILSRLHMRAMGKIQARVYEAWGVGSAHVAWEEVSQALQTGIVDGYLNPPSVAIMYGHQGQLDYFSDLRIWPAVRFVIVSEKWYQSLTETDRHLLRRAVDNARKQNRAWNQQAEEDAYRLLSRSNIQIIRVPPGVRADFRNASEPIYQSAKDQKVKSDIVNMAEQARTPHE